MVASPRLVVSVLLLAPAVSTPACVLVAGDDEAVAMATAGGGTDGGSTTEGGSSGADGSDVGDTGSSGGAGDSGTSGVDETGGTGALPSATAVDLAVGRLHTCALVLDDGVRCWGYADQGQLGNGVVEVDAPETTPVAVNGLRTGVIAIASRFDHTCVIADGGAVQCWGANGFGQLGDGTTSSSAVPVDVPGVTGAVAIDAGVEHTCAIVEDGGAKCWGHNDLGQLGDGSEIDATTPVDVSGVDAPLIAIATGRYNTCAVTGAGAVKCWGGDLYGELGNGEPESASATPVDVVGLQSGVVAISAGDSVVCAITETGGAACWGSNAEGQLGNGVSGSFEASAVPVEVAELVDVSGISPGFGFTCAVDGGAARCWGSNFDLALGNGEGPGYASALPIAVSGLGVGVAEIGAGRQHACARTDGGAVWCWGTGGAGALGNGSIDDSAVPVAVVGLP